MQIFPQEHPSFAFSTYEKTKKKQKCFVNDFAGCTFVAITKGVGSKKNSSQKSSQSIMFFVLRFSKCYAFKFDKGKVFPAHVRQTTHVWQVKNVGWRKRYIKHPFRNAHEEVNLRKPSNGYVPIYQSQITTTEVLQKQFVTRWYGHNTFALKLRMIVPFLNFSQPTSASNAPAAVLCWHDTVNGVTQMNFAIYCHCMETYYISFPCIYLTSTFANITSLTFIFLAPKPRSNIPNIPRSIGNESYSILQLNADMTPQKSEVFFRK